MFACFSSRFGVLKSVHRPNGSVANILVTKYFLNFPFAQCICRSITCFSLFPIFLFVLFCKLQKSASLLPHPCVGFSLSAGVWRLTISSARLTDTGNYSCMPSNAEGTSAIVHVINGEWTSVFLYCLCPFIFRFDFIVLGAQCYCLHHSGVVSVFILFIRILCMVLAKQPKWTLDNFHLDFSRACLCSIQFLTSWCDDACRCFISNSFIWFYFEGS